MIRLASITLPQLCSGTEHRRQARHRAGQRVERLDEVVQVEAAGRRECGRIGVAEEVEDDLQARQAERRIVADDQVVDVVAVTEALDVEDQAAAGQGDQVAVDVDPARRIARADDAADDHVAGRVDHRAVAAQHAERTDLERRRVDGAVVHDQRARAAGPGLRRADADVAGVHDSAGVQGQRAARAGLAGDDQ
jgi:hypothetical protein